MSAVQVRKVDVIFEEDDDNEQHLTQCQDDDDDDDYDVDDDNEDSDSGVGVVDVVKEATVRSNSPPIPALQQQKQQQPSFDEVPIKASRLFAEDGLNNSNSFSNSSDDVILPTLAKTQTVRILEPSPDALLDEGELHPCPTCGRKFVQKTYDRHIKICEKVSTKKRKVFDLAKKRLEGLDNVSPTRKSSSDHHARKKPTKPEDEFKKCPHCSRNFGHKAFDRHVTWCEEKSRRMQTSPNKDMLALAKLQARVAYRPKTPNRKESSGSTGNGTPTKTSFTRSIGDTPASTTSMTSNDGGDHWTRSLSRGSIRKSSNGTSETRSLGRAGGISFLDTVDHTKETPDTHFIRAATGRGSIKRGPAPTKASVLRQQKAIEIVSPEEKARAKTPNVPRRITSPVVTSPRKAASPGFQLQSQPYNINNNVYSYLIKPSAVRPSSSKSSVGLRREPEGIEHVAEDKMSERARSVPKVEPLLNIGQYDHSQEYDPFQSAARQMQELLFGTTSSSSSAPTTARQHSSGSASSSANLRPSTNSAFQRYVPSPDVPSTADINSKFLARNKLDSYMAGSSSSTPRRSDTMRSSWDGSASSKAKSWNPESAMTSSMTSSTTIPSVSRGGSIKVAKFCHECGNPFALPDIRFCCECGVKRLYC